MSSKDLTGVATGIGTSEDVDDLDPESNRLSFETGAASAAADVPVLGRGGTSEILEAAMAGCLYYMTASTSLS
jgi:hypothetical protein